jgi:hypothetical protein
MLVMGIPVVISIGYTVLFVVTGNCKSESDQQPLNVMEYLQVADFMMKTQMRNSLELTKQNRNLISSQKTMDGQGQLTDGVSDYLTWDDEAIDADFSDMQ